MEDFTFLCKEAVTLFPAVSEWYSMVLEHTLADYDFVGLYILAYLSLRRPSKWACGKISLIDCTELHNISSAALCSIPHFNTLVSDTYLKKLFGGDNISDITVVEIFSKIRFTGIKKNTDNFVNNSIVQWALGKRPYNIMCRVPSPLEVLRMQASGRRVITSFVTIDDMSKPHTAQLTYMGNNINHSRDPFEFLVHDMVHMEHFTDPNTYLEQVGFFKSILGVHDGSPKRFFKKMFPVEEICKHLWAELEYLISDMYVISFSLHI
jgi:hypothetical protein